MCWYFSKLFHQTKRNSSGPTIQFATKYFNERQVQQFENIFRLQSRIMIWISYEVQNHFYIYSEPWTSDQDMSYQSDSWIFNVFQIKWRQSSIPHKIVIWTKHQGAAVEPSILSEMVKCVQVCDTLLWCRHNICDKLNNKYWFIVHWY